ncbi:MAG: hypothetical protein ABR516_04060, partial [Desulfuromonadaceae bacterium]
MRFFSFCVALSVIFLSIPSAGISAGADFVRLSKELKPAVVNISTSRNQANAAVKSETATLLDDFLSHLLPSHSEKSAAHHY